MLSTNFLERLKPSSVFKNTRRSLSPTTKKASQCPISCLPDEILSSIFVLCLPKIEETRAEMNGSIMKRSITGQRPLWISSRSAPLNVSHVCRSWRSIALSTAKLWSKLAIQGTTSSRGYHAKRELAILSSFMQRNAEAPLDILVDINVPVDLASMDTYMMQCIQLLVAQKHRWRSVHLVYCFCQVRIIAPILAGLVQEASPSVSELYFCMHSCSVEKNRDVTPTFFHPSLPGLTKLTLFSRGTQYDLSGCPRLRELSITSPTSLKDVKQWLIRCPTLETVSFGRVNVYNSLEKELNHGTATSSIETLTSLRSLSLYFDIASDLEYRVSNRAINGFLSSFSLPYVSNLILSLHPSAKVGKCLDIRPIICLLKASNPPIMSLDIHNFSIPSDNQSPDKSFGAPEQQMADLCRLTEGVQQLIINGDTVDSILNGVDIEEAEPRSHDYANLWPKLEGLVVTNPREITVKSLLRFAQEHSSPDSTSSPLKHLTIHECGRGSSERRRIRQVILKSPQSGRCRETGLQLRFSTSQV